MLLSTAQQLNRLSLTSLGESKLAFYKLLAADFFLGGEGKASGGSRKEEARQEQGRARFLPRAPRGLRREAPAVPQRGTLRNFWPSCSAGGGSWGLEMGPRARKTPLETMCGKYGAPGAGYFPLGFGSELVREAPHRQVARQGGSMAAVETPFS